MAQDRLETLRSLLAQDPRNTFARYGVAMEHVNRSELPEAMQEFSTLLAQSPDYAAAYFHGGQTLERMGDPDAARSLYEQGIAVTTRTGDAHTRSELQAALDLLG